MYPVRLPQMPETHVPPGQGLQRHLLLCFPVAIKAGERGLLGRSELLGPGLRMKLEAGQRGTLGYGVPTTCQALCQARCHLSSSPVEGSYLESHFRDKETETQGGHTAVKGR